MIDLIIRIARVVIYIWVASEALFLALLYHVGYRDYKPTPIVKTLQRLFVSLFLFFSLLAFSPVVTALDPASLQLFTLLVPGISLALGYYLSRFKKQSLERSEHKKLPIEE